MGRFLRIGVIGQGFLGGNLSDVLEARGFSVIRYSLELEYRINLWKIKRAQVVFVCVPTPTTKDGFDCSIVESVIKATRGDAVVVIRSTVEPKWINKMVKLYGGNRKRTIIYMPEFLTETTARYDIEHPDRNVFGVSDVNNKVVMRKVKALKDIVPLAPHVEVCSYSEASMIKYGGNCYFYIKNMYFNLLHDLCEAQGCEWTTVRRAMLADSRIGPVHTNVEHKAGRGAGGHCLIKDFEVFHRMVLRELPGDKYAKGITDANIKRNVKLLVDSGKDLDMLEGVYGKGVLKGVVTRKKK